MVVIHCDPKNVTTLACYNFDVHQPILIIFGANVAKIVSSQMVLFLSDLTSVSALPGERESRKLRVFPQTLNVALLTDTQNTFVLSLGHS